MDTRPNGAAVKLAVVEVLDRDGHARLIVPVWSWPVTIGRAIDCDVVLDDVHAAARHATLSDESGVLTLVVGDTVNGVWMKRTRVAAAERVDVPAGEVFQIGATRLRVRRVADELSPERPLVEEPAGRRVRVVALAAAVMAWAAGQFWLNTDPGGRLTDFLPIVLGLPLALAFWSGLWAVGSKLFRHRFDFWPHAHIAFSYSLAMNVLALALPIAAFSTGWAFPSRVAGIVVGGVAWAMVRAHLALLLPARPRMLTGVMGAFFIVGLSLFLVRNYQVHDRLFPQLYTTALAPPVLRLAPTVPTTRFFDEARSLRSVLDAHVGDEDDGESPGFARGGAAPAPAPARTTAAVRPSGRS
jgi:Inner membrane component of T3SS, cytoplasmic domain